MDRTVKYIATVLASALTAVGCSLNGYPLRLSTEEVVFQAVGGVQTVYPYNVPEVAVSEVKYSYDAADGSDIAAEDWIILTSDDVTESGGWRSVTIRATANETGRIRYCTLRLGNDGIMGNIRITQYAE